LLPFIEDRPGQELLLLPEEKAEGLKAAIFIFFNGRQTCGILAAEVAESDVQVKILYVIERATLSQLQVADQIFLILTGELFVGCVEGKDKVGSGDQRGARIGIIEKNFGEPETEIELTEEGFDEGWRCWLGGEDPGLLGEGGLIEVANAIFGAPGQRHDGQVVIQHQRVPLSGGQFIEIKSATIDEGTGGVEHTIIPAADIDFASA